MSQARERFKRREPCSHEDCAERTFYGGDDGYTYCRRGHQQSDRGTVVAEDTGELIITGRKHRRVDSEAESISTLHSAISGPKALELLLLCLQLVLRKQIKWLRDTQDFPADFEVIVKDLWTLQIRHLKPGAILDADTDDERSQMFSSQSEGESSGDTRSRSRQSSRRRRRRAGSSDLVSSPQTLKTLDLLALLYVASLILRTSTTIGDFYTWASCGDLLYYQSSKEVPHGMRRRLPGGLQKLLDPEIWLPPEDLHVLVFKKITLFREEYGLQIPPMNDTILTYRWIRELSLPLEVFVGSKRLLKMLDLSLDYSTSERRVESKMPEVLLMAVMVVTMKLLFPLQRHQGQKPQHALTALQMPWEEWHRIVSTGESPSGGRLSYKDAFVATEDDCFDMTDDNIDLYLDWYRSNMSSDHVSDQGRAAQQENFRRMLMDRFPVDTPRPPQHSNDGQTSMAAVVSDRLKSVQAALRLDSDGHVEGEHASNGMAAAYYRYRNVGDLAAPGHAPIKKLYEMAASICAVQLPRFVRAVLFIESQLAQYEQSLPT